MRRIVLAIVVLIGVSLSATLMRANAQDNLTWRYHKSVHDFYLQYDGRSHTYSENYAKAHHLTGTVDACNISAIRHSAKRFQWTLERQAAVGRGPNGIIYDWTPSWSSGDTSACRVNFSASGESVGRTLTQPRQLYLTQAQNDEVGFDQIPDPQSAPNDPVTMLFGPEFPNEGLYRIKLSTFGERGQLIGSYTRTITIKEFIFAMLGDSYASGEGLPDSNGQVDDNFIGRNPCKDTTLRMAERGDFEKAFRNGYDPINEPKSRRYQVDMKIEPQWLDLSAHRSLKSGHSLAVIEMAKELEREKGWATLFLNFASSGAKLENITRLQQNRYHWDLFPWNLNKNPPCQNCGQLDELKAAVGNRKIDILILSAGGNDVGFSGALSGMVQGAAMTEADYLRSLHDLGEHYSELNERLEQDINVDKVFLVGYPEDLFSSGQGETSKGCEVFETSFSDLYEITYPEALVLKNWGERLRARQKEVADEHGWTFIDVSGAFIGHGYCSKKGRFLTHAEESCNIQGDMFGTMHPNQQGAEAYKKEILAHLRKYLESAFGSRPPAGRSPLPDKEFTETPTRTAEDAVADARTEIKKLRRERARILQRPQRRPQEHQPVTLRLDCKKEGSNRGCTRIISCPDGYRVSSIKAACNLEFGSVSRQTLTQLRKDTLSVVRPSDTVKRGVCAVGSTEISENTTDLKRELGARSIRIHCKERDKNGGDCHILGQMTCTDGKW